MQLGQSAWTLRSVLVVSSLKSHRWPLAAPADAASSVSYWRTRRLTLERLAKQMRPLVSVLWFNFDSWMNRAPTGSLSPSEPRLDSELQCRGEYAQLRSSWVCCYQTQPAEGSARRKKSRGLNTDLGNRALQRQSLFPEQFKAAMCNFACCGFWRWCMYKH